MSKNRIFKPKIFTNQSMEATVEYITSEVSFMSDHQPELRRMRRLHQET